MAVRPRYIKLEQSPQTKSGEQGVDSPVVTLLYLSGQGVVFKSRQNFDTGTKLAIGLHLDKVREDLGLQTTGSLFDLNPFLDVQGFVADCKITEVSPTDASYQVTLLFDELDESDEMLIEAIVRELDQRNQAPVLSAPRHESGLN